MGSNTGVADIPNYPRENPLFDEDQPQHGGAKEEEPEPVAQPVFHDNPAFDEKTSRQPAVGSPMIPSRGSPQGTPQQGGGVTYESTFQVPEHLGELRSGMEEEDPVQHNERRTTSLDIPPMFDPSNVQAYPSDRPQGGPSMPGQLTNQGHMVPQFVNTAAEQEAVFAAKPAQPELHRQLSEPRDIPHEERVAPNEPQVFDNSTFEQQGQRQEEPYGEGYMQGQREQPSEAVTAANAAVEEEVMNSRSPQAEAEMMSNAAEDGRGPLQQSFEQQGPVPHAETAPAQVDFVLLPVFLA